jgi:hypothetical protein
MFEKGDKVLAMAMAASVSLMMALFFYDNTIDWRRMMPIWIGIMAAPMVWVIGQIIQGFIEE